MTPLPRHLLRLDDLSVWFDDPARLVAAIDETLPKLRLRLCRNRLNRCQSPRNRLAPKPTLLCLQYRRVHR